MTDPAEILESARDAHRRRDWSRARDLFSAASELGELSADDLSALGDAAWWLGRVDESVNANEAAYRRYLQGDQPRQAAMAAMGIAITLALRGDEAVGSGWMSRVRRLLRGVPENVEHGYLLYLIEVEGGLNGPHLDAVVTNSRRVQDIGRRFGDPNLVAAGTIGEGRALVRQGNVAQGMALLDEAMLSVLAEELVPDWAGNIYCHMMAACHELVDIRRAGDWMEATTRWLQTLPAAVLFSGVCRVHRSQVLQVRGSWAEAESEALRVCDELAGLHVAGAAEGHYQVAEMRRLRGDARRAEAAYRAAHGLGRDPQPGLALLRLAQGRLAAAAASTEAALASVGDDRLARFPLRAAQVEIALAGDDLAVAQRASDELTATAATYRSPGLEAAARHARGAVELAEGHAAEALPILRDACRRWQRLDAPYDAARARVLLARAYDLLGDADVAELEAAAARAVFERLGAAPDLGSLDRLRTPPGLPGGLTAREAEVLACVATGRTNREVAAELVLSEKTVARHLSNIFNKLGLSSRTEAAAYAFEHGLRARPTG